MILAHGKRVILLLTVITISLSLYLINTGNSSVFAESPACSEKRSIDLSKQLLCPQCAGQTIHQSQSPIAENMRSRVCSLIEEGSSDQEILDYFVERYSTSILASPPKAGFSLTIWIVPPIVIGAGIFLLLLALKLLRNSNQSSGRVRENKGTADLELVNYLDAVDSEIPDITDSKQRTSDKGA